jgi:ABC-type lipoprotein export system ATPase subunit
VSVIRVVGVSKVYDGAGGRVEALRDVSLDVRPGELVALMGPSGCGKSTLLNLIGAIDRPTAGEVWLDGIRLAGLPDAALTRIRRDRVGIVYQLYNLLPSLSARENVALPRLLQGAPWPEALREAGVLLERVGVAARAAHWPHELSGGEMQRVAVARALANRPAVVLADEPTGNLDSEAGAAVLRLLRGLASSQAQTIVLATHAREAAAIADRVVALRDGRIESRGSRGEEG